MEIKVKKIRESAILPIYKTDGAAGFDLFAAEDVFIEPGETKRVPLGLAFEIPTGYVMYIMPRSGISFKSKLRQPNSVGVIDSDYRGEVQMMFENNENDNGKIPFGKCAIDLQGQAVVTGNYYPTGTYVVRKGEAICQGIIQKVEHALFVESDKLSKTKRGTGGFGSTGV
ncbi:dUTP diphosphatase [Halalkalibacterium halodurans]|uniref:dUTP diphosphatase n=1 Tax=Halalkalibacterium halodurans TaxID=86665 RepID=UPI002AAA36C6|nr:dUTP diphosphatase [Halalkalibacterium halodurans]MDY7224642.1 dUTP diphosphatase [Halalkalibacterium halodurans]MDY7243251.1 dUTP diphosphatase [Halalkalibacterium halodurans]